MQIIDGETKVVYELAANQIQLEELRPHSGWFIEFDPQVTISPDSNFLVWPRLSVCTEEEGKALGVVEFPEVLDFHKIKPIEIAASMDWLMSPGESWNFRFEQTFIHALVSRLQVHVTWIGQTPIGNINDQTEPPQLAWTLTIDSFMTSVSVPYSDYSKMLALEMEY